VEESPLADETLEAVRVLTVHKAKGLEFDAVIVADLCRGEGSARGRGIEIGWSRGEGGGLAVRTPRGLNARRILHEREEALHEEAEALRTFYVACTRARRCLILVAGPVDADAADRPWPAALKAWGYDARQPPAGDALLVQGVRHVDVDGRRAPAAGVAGSIPSCEEEVSRFSRAAQAAGSGARVRERTPSGLVENRWETRERREGPTVPQPEGHGAALGRVLHRALERWDGKGDGAGALEEALGRTAAETGPSSIALEREARALWDSVRRSFIPGLLREGAVLGREIPILMEDDGVVWYGSVDLLYREAGDAWVVVDYKTEDPGPDPELQARRFLPQLRVYARAIRKAAGISPRAEIFWVRTGERSVLPAEDL
jgi:ATP-dependent helicase/nuclease subunit A